MLHGTHELIGVSVALAGARLAEAPALETAGLVGAAFYGSWLPDVDRLGARVHRRTRLERRNVLIGGLMAAVRLPALGFAVLARHRGLTHSLLGVALAAVCGALVLAPAGRSASLVAGLGLGVGYLAHVLADGLTPGGVPLWAPISRSRVRLAPRGLRVPTGSLREAVFALVAVGLVVLVVTW